MINQLQSTTSKYENVLHTSLETALNHNDLISALTSFDDASQNDRLKFVLNNYTKTHLSSVAHATLINDAIATLQ